jgi:hypothetical protein
MSAISDFVEKAYTSYLLRDFTGKVLPGAILVASFLNAFAQDRVPGFLRVICHFNFVSEGVFVMFGLAVLWMLGYAIQSLGDLTTRLWYGLKPKDEETPNVNLAWTT